jgi:tetratricopeptide (TPR) repeat protein
MEDFVEILKTILAVIGVVFFIILGTLLYASDKTEDIYQSAIVNMDKGNWDSAIKQFEQIPNYKESTDLYLYSFPHKNFYADYKSIDDEIIGYKETINYIKQNLAKFKGTSKAKYEADFKELEKVLNYKIAELNVKKGNDIIKKDFEDSIELIKQGKHQEALIKLNNIKDDSMYGVEKKHLIGYINILEVTKAVGDNPENITKEIRSSVVQIVSSMNPYFTGPFAQEIQRVVQPYVDSEKWLQDYMKTTKNEQTVQKSKISQGMKKWELTLAQGNPVSEYKISNKYGTFERVTFNEGKIIYLENGIVTAVNN